MVTLDEIKQLMAAGETAEADKALKELLEKEPNNLHAKMLYGTCRQLLGDEETFRRIHDELAQVMENLLKEDPKAETVSLWKKYHALWVTLIIAGLILVGTVGAAYYYGKYIMDQYTEALNSLYAGPEYYQIRERETIAIPENSKYRGPPRNELEVESAN